nr:cobalamin biosynthesis protein CbiL [uncultured Cohaesibacter sp.]
MIRLFLIAVTALALFANPAAAHKLKVFAATKGEEVTGYAFFIGGGRAQGTSWTAKNAAGSVLAEGTTDDQGQYAFAPPSPVQSDITITVNTHEGHIASTTIPASRFGGTEPTLRAQSAAHTAARTSPAGSPAETPSSGQPIFAAPDLQPMIEAAVQRQVEPLLERIEQMDSRMRFTDILSGIFLIIGLAGIGLWARSRR